MSCMLNACLALDETVLSLFGCRKDCPFTVWHLVKALGVLQRQGKGAQHALLSAQPEA